jgi:hypothetical protein
MANSSSRPTRGRPVDPNSTSGKIRALLGTGMALGDIAKKLGCPQSLVYAVKAREAGGGRAKSKKSGRATRPATEVAGRVRPARWTTCPASSTW